MYSWLRRFARGVLFQVIPDLAWMPGRQFQQRALEPTAAILHTQTIKASAAARHEFDAAK